MSNLRVARTFLGIAALAAHGWLVAAGCENTAGDCQLTAECTGAPGQTTTTTTSAPATCVPGEGAGPLADTCGLFVSASAEPGGDGSQARPFSTLAAAIEAAKDRPERRVYACAETFAEAVVLPAELTLHGGLDCANGWAFDADARTTIAPTAGIPVTFAPGKKTRVENVEIVAPPGAPPDPASANPLSGGSSIAALAQPGSTVELVRCDLEAGDGAPGASAMELPPVAAAADGGSGDAACLTGAGGLAGVNGCGDPPTSTNGGNGGMGGDTVSADGMPGSPGQGAFSAAGGSPQTGATPCTAGDPGQSGDPGKAGAGGALKGTLLDEEHKGSPGTAGEAGRPGNGGGGGGGGKACTNDRGAGGGAGGAGGCAGAKGDGGGAGGSSIALWAVEAEVTLEQVTLTTKKGGAGGAGAAGQQGGAGGKAGVAGAAADGSEACAGGEGGSGGDGGPGGGGEGGHSVAIVWNTVPPKLLETTFLPGAPGVGGAGGASEAAPPDGADGLACDGFDTGEGACESP